jgi:hypothetical protein
VPTREKRAKALGVPVDQLPDGRGRHGNHARGANHPRWNEGRMVTEEGYVKVRVGTVHPLADANGYCYEHTLVATAALGRHLSPDETVHHRNHDKLDNRWENLEILTRSAHAVEHNQQRERDANGRFVGGQYPTSGGDRLDGEQLKAFPHGSQS